MHRRIGFVNVLHATSEIWSIGRQTRVISFVWCPDAPTLVVPAPARRYRHDVESGIYNLVAGDMTAGYRVFTRKRRRRYRQARPAMDANGNLGLERAVGAGRASLGGALPLASEIFQLLWRGCRFFSLLVSEATPIHVTFSEKAL